ncbi:hypothetical protein HPB51_006173 [Rhipicephalus microplus]|uniref:Uncharacterized protein n=1 Tax=Rhipicephalus microplus TaxID=6941 RepID=A0A9J6E661_RHIMP|nr:hypothetical protein HPB51_006173 [Rhipicephalus microplus]
MSLTPADPAAANHCYERRRRQHGPEGSTAPISANTVTSRLVAYEIAIGGSDRVAYALMKWYEYKPLALLKPSSGASFSKEGNQPYYYSDYYSFAVRARHDLANGPSYQATPHLNGAQQASPLRNDLKPYTPLLRRYGPLPRVPPDAIHIVGRPKTSVYLTKRPPSKLYEALLKATSPPDQAPASRDKVQVHPTNNTFTLSGRESVQAQAYFRIT